MFSQPSARRVGAPEERMKLRTAIVASVGLGLLAATLVWSVPAVGEAVPQLLWPPAALFVIVTSLLLPDSIKGQYDPVGHPALWFVGLALTFATPAFALLTLARVFARR